MTLKLDSFSSSAHAIASAVNAQPALAKDVADYYLARVAKYQKELNCFLHFDEQDVVRQVEAVRAACGKGKKLPLAGVPVAIKDNICVADMPTTCASKILAGFRPPYDATAVTKLREAGAIIFGKVNCDEFAMGSSNENSAYGAVRNPWDLERVPGGSSGGSAAVVAADLAPVALGSDTGGSIRQPASFCGIAGLKPTYGRISRYGLVAFGSSLDQIGPMTRSVLDAALVTDVLSGCDAMDSTSSSLAPTKIYDDLLAKAQSGALSIKGMKLGLVSEFFGDGLDKDVRQQVMTAVEKFKELGATVTEMSLPHLKYSIAAYYVIATAEASANLARFDGIRYGLRCEKAGDSLRDVYQQTRNAGFGREVKQRIMLGTFVLSSGYYDAYYGKANAVRELITKDFNQAFAKVDLLLSPTSPSTSFKIGEKANDPLSMYLSDICTIGVNLAGIPGLAIPCGFDSKGMPVGLQILGPHFSEAKILEGAFAYEQATQWWSHKRPKI